MQRVDDGVSLGVGPEGERMWRVDTPDVAHALLRRAAGLSKRSWGATGASPAERFVDVRNLVQPIFVDSFLLESGELWRRWRGWLVPFFSPSFGMRRLGRFDALACESLAAAFPGFGADSGAGSGAGSGAKFDADFGAGSGAEPSSASGARENRGAPIDVQRVAHVFALRGVLEAVFGRSEVPPAVLARVEDAVEHNLADSVARWDAGSAPAAGHDVAARPAMAAVHRAVADAVDHALQNVTRAVPPSEGANAGPADFDLVTLVARRAAAAEIELESLRHEIVANAANLIIAGAESLAAGLAFSLMELSACPAAQTRARAAAREVLSEMGSDGVSLGADEYARLAPVTHALVEGMRLHPPARKVHRRAGELDPTSAAGCLAQRGAAPDDPVALRVDRIHRHPESVSSPNEYRPERFDPAHPEQGQAWKNFLAFSSGQRACPGRSYALVEGTMFLARLLRDHEVRRPEDFSPPRGLGKPTTWAVEGMTLELVRV